MDDKLFVLFFLDMFYADIIIMAIAIKWDN